MHASHVVHIWHPKRFVVASDGLPGMCMHCTSLRAPHVSQYAIVTMSKGGVSNRSLVAEHLDRGKRQSITAASYPSTLVQSRPVACFSLRTLLTTLVSPSFSWRSSDARPKRRVLPMVVVHGCLVLLHLLSVLFAPQFFASARDLLSLLR